MPKENIVVGTSKPRQKMQCHDFQAGSEIMIEASCETSREGTVEHVYFFVKKGTFFKTIFRIILFLCLRLFSALHHFIVL